MVLHWYPAPHQTLPTETRSWYARFPRIWYGMVISKVVLCRVRTNRTHTPGITLQIRIFCKFCRAFIPVPGTSVSSVGHSYPYPELLAVLYARGHNTRGTGTACFVPARSFCELCTPVPQYPELLEVLQDIRTRTRNFWKFCKITYPHPESL